ncbi:family 16 glycosylhydrolase [Luteococcus sp.]|uniref:glycoside hydrolase family 16 protein n=1 Tax=Luteococcus sp. TaxID=1969402 RepID=UPI0026470394|nr:family 16 glycosylhydrolase [Luteococcus sp.]
MVGGLAAGGVAGGARLLSDDSPHPSEGLRLAFDEGFASLDGFDLTGHGARGKTWFLDRPFGWGKTRADEISAADGVLTLSPRSTSRNYTIATMSPTTGAGKSFLHGYFEARMSFDPIDATASDGFPAFWALAAQQFLHMDQTRSMEVDFFEAMHPTGRSGIHPDDTFAGTAHDMLLVPTEVDRANYGDNTRQLRGVDWTQFHDYGCKWSPGRLEWFFDDQPLMSLAFGEDVEPSPNSSSLPKGIFSPLEQDRKGLVVVLGTGVNYPLRVERVRVWQ